jgi:hypothetical protein
MSFTAVDNLSSYSDYPGYPDAYFYCHGLAVYGGDLYLAMGGLGIDDMGDIRRFTAPSGSVLSASFGGAPLTGTVTAVDGGAPKRIFTDSARTEADAFFESQQVRFTSGPNTAGSRVVIDYVSDTFTADRNWPSDIAVGHAYSVRTGVEDIMALSAFGGLLFAGFSHLFVNPGPPTIWAWNGTTWLREAMLEGPGVGGFAIDWSVLSFFEHAGELYAGTWMNANVPIRVWHRVNSTTWEKAYEQGAATKNQETQVWAGTSLGGALYTGDTQGGLITFDGSTWSRNTTLFDVDTGSVGRVAITAFAVHDGAVWMAGSDFTSPFGLAIYKLISGTWTLQTTLALGFVDAALSPAQLISHHGELFVFVQNLAYRRDGGAWTLDTTFAEPAELTHRAIVFNDRLYVIEGTG